MEKQQYLEHVKKTAPKSKQARTLFWAFVIGGTICCIGQGVADIFIKGFKIANVEKVANITSSTMIVIASILTGIGVYDRIGAFAGAGSIVPITGFANSIVSPAMEFNREGIVLGVMSKMFVIAGPVIVSGITFSMLIGIIHWIVGIV